MKKTFLIWVTGAAFLCGCDKQTKLNTEKIDLLSQKLVQLQQNQAQQMAAIQSQLKSLGPMLDKMNNFYFEKNHEDALFYHTNTLLLLLTVDRKIEAQLQAADTEREAERSLAYYYHTNQTDTMYFCTAQIQDFMGGQEKRIEDTVNAETRRMGIALGDELVKQIKESAPGEVETASRLQMETEIAQIKSDLEAIKMRLAITNPVAK